MAEEKNNAIEIVNNAEFLEVEQPDDVEIVEGQIISVEPMNVKAMGDTYNKMREFVRQSMTIDVDFGLIPGVSKKSLYKPGAEKLQRFFGLSAVTTLVDKVEQWEKPIDETSFPLFHYRYVTKVYGHNGRIIATCEGEANSYEAKYRWRWVSKDKVPAKYDLNELETQPGTEREPDFAIKKKEVGGKYGKPIEYWEQWEQDIASGKATKVAMKKRDGSPMDAWERDGSLYRVPNEDIHSQVNTIMKISQKRSYVGAVIIAANASEFFTQDVEDMNNANVDTEAQSIYDYVPSKLMAAQRLVKHAVSLGVHDAGLWINVLFEENKVEWSLDNWVKIVDLVNENARK